VGTQLSKTSLRNDTLAFVLLFRIVAAGTAVGWNSVDEERRNFLGRGDQLGRWRHDAVPASLTTAAVGASYDTEILLELYSCADRAALLVAMATALTITLVLRQRSRSIAISTRPAQPETSSRCAAAFEEFFSSSLVGCACSGAHRIVVAFYMVATRLERGRRRSLIIR